MTVTALLVCRDGARWLPAVLEGLERQSLRPDRVLAVDAGSTDGTGDLLRGRLGEEQVVETAPGSFAAAVAAGLDRLPPPETDDDWVWLLHDDSAPAPTALAELVAAAAPGIAALGPKLREWPSLRRLLEVGVTISGSGRRETGLETGEYDQGQHDRSRDVLAVNTAGMLVRLKALTELGGFDRRLPVFFPDIDFGWRAARAGHRVRTAPAAVVFHAEAARRGLRGGLSGRATVRREERRSALYTVLVNCAPAALPFQLLRLLLGGLLRALGLLLVRAPAEAYGELAALATTYLRPDRIIAGRRARRRTATVPARDVRHLLAPAWMPLRHGLDLVSDLAGAVVAQARGSTSRGALPALLAHPAVWVLGGLVGLALVGARGLVGAGLLSGGALLPAPDSAATWWEGYLALDGMPWAGVPWVLPLGLAGALLLGEAWLVLDLLFLLAVPLSAAGAYRFLRLAAASRQAGLWGAVAYGLLPVLTGAVAQGRLGTVAASLVLPWVAASALFLGPAAPAERRWRAAWRTALGLALLTAFVPIAWPLAVLLTLVALVAAGRTAAGGRWQRLLQTAVPVLATPVLLLPWFVLGLSRTDASVLLDEAGLPARNLVGALTAWDVVAARAAELGAPHWISSGVVLAAVMALVRADTRPRVLVAWTVLVVALVPVAVLGAVVEPSEPVWLGFPLLVAQAAAITAAALAGSGVVALLTGRSFGWRQPVGAVVVLAALASPAAGLVWWVATAAEGPLDRQPPVGLPAYMRDSAAADVRSGVLVVTGTRSDGYTYRVVRGDGYRTGEERLATAAANAEELTGLVRELVTAPTPDTAAALGGRGIAFVHAPAPADPVLAGSLDTVSGLVPASAVRPRARAWQVEAAPAPPDRVSGPDRTWLTAAIAGQLAAVGVVLVLAAPSRKVRR